MILQHAPLLIEVPVDVQKSYLENLQVQVLSCCQVQPVLSEVFGTLDVIKGSVLKNNIIPGVQET